MRTILILGLALLAFAPAVDAQQQPVHPREGAVLDRRHVRFRWPSFETREYRLQIVEDDGSPDPFSGPNPLGEHVVDGDEPRALVTTGLEWGKEYAWRVLGEFDASLASPKRTVVRRFEVAALSPEVPLPNLIVPPGAGPPEPGIALYPLFRYQSPNGYVLGVDEAGELVLQMAFPNEFPQDVRLLEDGRLLLNTQANGGPSGACRRAFVMTLDGGIVWASPDTHCQAPPPPPFAREGAHHEVFPMPEAAPNGANFLVLEYDNRIIPFGSNPNLAWQGDRAREYDRHTLEVVWEWSVFDGVSLHDHLPPSHPHWPGPGGDWTHTNSVVYVLAQNSVYLSLRRQSRIVRVDYATRQVVYHMGEDSFPANDVPPGFGDNLFSAQHAPQVLANGHLLVYDNGNYIEPLANPRVSRAIELYVDHLANPPLALPVWSFPLVQEDLVTPAYADAAGKSERLPGGHTISSDARNANLLECDEDGELVWFLDAGPRWPQDAMGNPGAQIYRVVKVPAIEVDTPGDADGDHDLDLADLAALQNGFRGALGGQLMFPDVLCDHDGDGDVDAVDAERFAYYLSGPAR